MGVAASAHRSPLGRPLEVRAPWQRPCPTTTRGSTRCHLPPLLRRPRRASDLPWWRTATVYQVYPRSFADSDGDGIGDLPGLIDHLDHIAGLGADVLWVSPFYPSPQVDNGYDISDYRGVDPVFGTMDDIDELVRQVHARGMRLVIDIVVNHTSDQHPWFLESRSSPTTPSATGTGGVTQGRPSTSPGRRLPTAPPPARPAPRLPTIPRRQRPRRQRPRRQRPRRQRPRRQRVRAGAGRPAHQLADVLLPAGLDLRRTHRPVLAAPVHTRAARPQLGEPGRARGRVRHAAMVAGSWCRRLSHGRHQPGVEGPAAHGRAVDRRRPPGRRLRPVLQRAPHP